MIPEWLLKLFPFLKSSSAEEWKAISEARKGSFEEIKQLKDEYKSEIESHKKRIKELEAMSGEVMHPEDLEILLEREKGYHGLIIELMEENRDLKEEIIFLTKGKRKQIGE